MITNENDFVRCRMSYNNRIDENYDNNNNNIDDGNNDKEKQLHEDVKMSMLSDDVDIRKDKKNNNDDEDVDTGNHQSWNFNTKLSFVLTSSVLVFFLILSAYYNTTTPSGSSNSDGSATMEMKIRNHNHMKGRMNHNHRSVYVVDGNGDDNNNDDNKDYSTYSCHYLYDITPDPGDEQCQFARSCNFNKGLWAPWVYCHNKHLSTAWLFGIISPFITLWLVILFRLLGTTAEDYFSPSLEMFSMKMGLPPRFAGVTLLALGNGAADVSATVNAITSDKENGYKMSLGALTGAAMFVGGVVAAVVIIVAGGIPCRGALVRDVLALAITVIVTWTHLAKGEIGPEAISLFLTLYGVFVMLVLVADIYHRSVVIPRMEVEARQTERERQLEEARRVSEAAGDDLNALAAAEAGSEDSEDSQVPLTPDRRQKQEGTPKNALSTILTAISNYDNTPTSTQQQQHQQQQSPNEGWGIESDDIQHERPIMLHGSHGILHGRATNTESAIEATTLGEGSTNAEGNTISDSPYSILQGTGSDDSGEVAAAGGGAVDVSQQICLDTQRFGGINSATLLSASNWKAAWYDGKQELYTYMNQLWEDIAWNGDIHIVDKFLQMCELPFTILRKVTIPIPCEGYYCRALIALSIALSPLWLGFYFVGEHKQYTIFTTLEGLLYLFIFELLALVCGGFVLRYAPGSGSPGGDAGDPAMEYGANGDVMALGVSGPIALYGFIIAATWIDFIADQLVNLLDFLGIVLRIPGPIIGLTILAWGNSVADLTANITMARKGLANMAITACFAGPVFNILVGLGLGFSSLSAATGEMYTKVELRIPVVLGFIFILLNSVAIIGTGFYFASGSSGFIPKQYGYLALTLYTTYVISSIVMDLRDRHKQ